MNTYAAVLQIFLWTIAVVSGMIAWEFYRSKNGRLRILLIRLFTCKVWLYGGSAVYFWSHPALSFRDTAVRFVLITPMFIVMLMLWQFIRMRDYKA